MGRLRVPSEREVCQIPMMPAGSGSER